MIRREVEIVNKLGLHARAAARLVTEASLYDCEVLLRRAEQEVNGKSIMGVMMLAAGQGSRLTLITDGDDEENAMAALERLIADRFGEPE